ncbi:MAG TPA: hypothetical protein PLC15_25215 [Candidatus Obscuribacter sp.]|nr:hypothetical protein [Candidatus Obscuribacter sp.]MBL8084567.1 hypothetical protein [Candidatus Obscuribacter sp.]HMW92575.1 hypothetical protein [Candidatus Obscuribacter sp.]HNB18711.1 hypothetical protein [Candidatus Obscuribacter sp.]HND07719.1 hypothetical protein [Candidatus Obscuribacter sp.]
MKLQTIQIPCQPTAANDRRQISNLHVLEPDGKIRHFQGTTLSGGYFSSIYASRAGLITLFSPCVRPETADSGCRRHQTPSVDDPGIFVLPLGLEEGDWVIAREEQIYTDDWGWTYHLIAGTLPPGIEDVSQLIAQIYSAAALLEQSGGSLPFVEFKLYPVESI